jgi:hypothetical protein
VRRRNWAGEPTLLLGENACGYDELLAEVSRVLLPRAQARRSHCRCTALRGRMPARRPADRCPRHPRGAVAPSCACARGSRRAGFDTFRKRSQVPRTKPTSKNPTKTKLQDERRPIGGKTCGARPYWRAPPAGRNRATWTCGPRLRSQQRSAAGRSLMLTNPPYTSPFPSQARLHRA